jgi:speckle-type POZ protein
MANVSMAVVNQVQCLAKTSSTCVVGSVTATHDIGEFVSSSTFSVGGRDWNIKLYPDGDNTEHKDHVSVFLCFLSGPVGARVKYNFSLLGKKGNQAEVPMKHTRTFDCPSNWGFSFIKKSELEELLRLNYDCLAIRCVVSVIKDPRTEDISIVAVPQSNLAQNFERMLKDGQGTSVTFCVDG